MSIQKVQMAINKFLSDESPEVLAIKGKWGTGKTYCWNNWLKAANKKELIKLQKYAYISLFGIRSLDELKIMIFEQTVDKELIDDGASLKTLQTNTDKVIKSLGRKTFRFLQGTPWLENFGTAIQSATFLTLNKTIICFDDLERKGDTLSFKDFLGLVSLLKEQRQCKIVLILNDNSFDDKSLDELNKFKEKVVGIELKFDPSSEECANIVFEEADIFKEELSKFIQVLNIKNMRTIQRIRKVTKEVISLLLDDLEKEVLVTACQSLTLLIWCYYGKDDGAPDYEYLKKFKYSFFRSDEELSDQERIWHQILGKYNYWATDEFDLTLANIIETGYIDKEKLLDEAAKFNKRIIAEKSGKSFTEAWKLYHETFEDNEDELVSTLYERFKIHAKYISLENLYSTVKLLRQLDKSNLAKELIDFYFEINSASLKKYDFRTDISIEIDDPDIIDKIDKIVVEGKRKVAIEEVLSNIIEKNGWNASDEKALSEATPDDYYSLFKKIKGEHLKYYVTRCLEFGQYPNSSDQKKQIANNATQALQKIAQESKLNQLRVKKFGIKIDSE